MEELSPEDRGRQPVGDQFPWIEVGENVFPPKSIGSFLPDLKLGIAGFLRDQIRLMITGPELEKGLTITDTVWIFLDIKSVGPRDDAPHAVMSHNQISGDGLWENVSTGTLNGRLIALGPRAQHEFWPAAATLRFE